MMASGKTTVGRLVAARLGRPFVDSDEQVEARTGRTVRELFAQYGEPYFRARETEALRDALAREEPSVIAAAGGVVLAPANRAALRDADALVVWLRAPVAVLSERIGPVAGHRPLLDHDPVGALEELGRIREPLYREVADLEVPVHTQTADEVAELVIAKATEP